MIRLALLLAALVLLPSCSDECLLTVHNEISEPSDAVLTSVSVRLEGTSYWPDVDLLDGRIPAGMRRQVRIPPSTPFVLDIRATDSASRSWSRLDALVCDVPDDEMTFTFTDADRDRPCTWTLINDTDTAFVSALLRRSGTSPWSRELLENPLAAGATGSVLVDDDRPEWDLQARGEDGSTWTRAAVGRCTDGAALAISLSGEPDSSQVSR